MEKETKKNEYYQEWMKKKKEEDPDYFIRRTREWKVKKMEEDPDYFKNLTIKTKEKKIKLKNKSVQDRSNYKNVYVDLETFDILARLKKETGASHKFTIHMALKQYIEKK